MWLDKMIQPQGDPWLLRWDLAATNFLDRDLPPAFLYYNPGPGDKRVTLEIAPGQRHAYDLSIHRSLPSSKQRIELTLKPGEARVIEIRS